MPSLLVLATEAAERTPVGWFVVAPFAVVMVVVVAVSPIWPYSRNWGWTIAGIFGMTAGTVAAFTAAWLAS